MKKTIPFLKMEGLGNDFIVTHELLPPRGTPERTAPLAVKLCDRRRGIGGDGLVLLLPSTAADFQMRIWNSDGSEAEMCGNGIRCCAVYAKKMKLSGKRTLRFETGAGTIVTELLKNGQVKVTMGRPVLAAPQIPTLKASGRVIMEDLRVDRMLFKVTAVSMGNPHAVIFEEQLTDELVQVWGRKIETNQFFPRKTNVEFVKVLSPTETRMRVWERGCGETFACGTGACASVVAGIINNLHGNRVTVHLLGGDLFVEWDGRETSPVYLTGPAKIAFSGSVETDL
jgi:diaminopimelate epimerase